MIIVYVIDSYGEFSNGTTMTALRSKKHLEKLGHTVRIVSNTSVCGPEYFHLKERHIPIVSKMSKKQSMSFAKPDKLVFEEAFKDADLVHLFAPFKASRVAYKVAKKMNIAISCAFHVQPEHISYGLGLGKYGLVVANFVYRLFYAMFFRKIKHVHCPTAFIAEKIKQHGYKNCIPHIVTNGVGKQFFTNPEREFEKDSYKILSIGRFSLEKRQETLIKAVANSKYKDKLEISFAGKGPRLLKLQKLVKKFNVKATFNFFDQKDLIEEIKKSDLYVHSAEAEIEGISALEAIASGLVPIIADSKQSATKQFTLDERSVFKVRNYKELASKIDYWLDNPNERKIASDNYKKHMENFKIENAILLLEEMFKKTIFDHKVEQLIKTKEGKKVVKNIQKSVKFKPISSFIYYLAIPFFFIYFLLIRGVRIRGRKNLDKVKRGSILVTNHVHKLDSVMVALSIFPKKPIFTSIPKNLENRIYRPIVRMMNGVPIPISIFETKLFILKFQNIAARGRFIHFFPEGNLITKNEELQKFKKGAFKIAEDAKVPIIPIRISFPKKHNRYPFFFKDRIVVNIGEPIYPNEFLLSRESINQLLNQTFNDMDNLKIN